MLCCGHAKNNATRTAKRIIAPAEYGNVFGSEHGNLCEPVTSVDSWLLVEMLATDLLLLMRLDVVKSNSAKSCLVTMSWSSIATFEANIAIVQQEC